MGKEKEEQLKKELDFLYLYPQAPEWQIEEKEAEFIAQTDYHKRNGTIINA